MIVLGILCLIIMVFILLNYRYKNSFYYQNLVEFENRPVRKIYWSDKIKMVNLGSVHARFAFQYFKNEGVSLARAPQSLYYDIQLLENYSKHIPRDTIVVAFFPICLFALKNFTSLNQIAKYYYELPKDRIEKYSLLKYIIAVKYPILYAGKKAIYSIVNRKIDSEWSYQKCVVSEERLKKIAQEHCDVWKKQFQLENLTDADTTHLIPCFEYNRKLLERLVDKCKAQGWKLVFVTGPMARQMNEMFSEKFLQNFYYSNFQDIAEKNNVLHLDYRLDDTFQDDNNLFWNGVDWLSETGRRVFMEKLENDLYKNGYWEGEQP